MVTINNTMPANGSAALPVVGNLTPKSIEIKAPGAKAAPADVPSTDVQISAAAKAPQVSGLTSVQFDVDQGSGKTVVSVISKDDNHVIRQIPTSLTLAKSLSTVPVAPSKINTAV